MSLFVCVLRAHLNTLVKELTDCTWVLARNEHKHTPVPTGLKPDKLFGAHRYIPILLGPFSGHRLQNPTHTHHGSSKCTCDAAVRLRPLRSTNIEHGMVVCVSALCDAACSTQTEQSTELCLCALCDAACSTQTEHSTELCLRALYDAACSTQT